MLRAQRRAAAAASAPAIGAAGQNLDLALLLADGTRAVAADPAFEDRRARLMLHVCRAEWNEAAALGGESVQLAGELLRGGAHCMRACLRSGAPHSR